MLTQGMGRCDPSASSSPTQEQLLRIGAQVTTTKCVLIYNQYVRPLEISPPISLFHLYFPSAMMYQSFIFLTLMSLGATTKCTRAASLTLQATYDASNFLEKFDFRDVGVPSSGCR